MKWMPLARLFQVSGVATRAARRTGIRAIQVKLNADRHAETRNGTGGPRRKSAPPSAGPMMTAACSETALAAAARGKASAETSAGSSDDCAGELNTRTVPSPVAPIFVVAAEWAPLSAVAASAA